MTVNTTQTLTRPAANGAAASRPEQQTVIAGTRPRPSSSAGEMVVAYLRTQQQALAAHEDKVRADEYDAVHQMRVAIRRLRAALRSFRQVIPRRDSEHLDAELQWLGHALGRARDDEVLTAHLRDILRTVPAELLIGPVQARVQGHFAPRRAASNAAVLEAFDSPRYAALLAELDRLTRESPRARKSARRARYAAEAAAPAAGKPARKFAGQMKRIQSVIGDHHDTVVARQEARDLGIGAYLAGENAFTYGLLHERELHRAQQLEARARRDWQRASRRRYRRWMK